MRYICIDIGGTAVKHGLLETADAGTPTFLSAGETPTQAHLGGQAVLEKVVTLARHYAEASPCAGVCISTAGMVDCTRGLIVHSAPLIPGYTGINLKAAVEQALALPCEVENDVNCAGLAEHFFGASRHTHSSLCLTVGTGIGGCLIVDGRVVHGAAWSGCEIGYLHLPGGAFQDLGAASVLSRRVEAAKGEQGWDGRRIFAAAKGGDNCCLAAIEEMADVLGMGIANICYVANPEIVVLGGGIMAQQDILRAPIRAAVDRYLVPYVARHTRLAFAENKNQAGMLGAFCHFAQLHP